MRIITWNVNWARPDGYRGELIKNVISELEPEVVCITEGHKEIFTEGYSIFSDADYGYKSSTYRRKVILGVRIRGKRLIL